MDVLSQSGLSSLLEETTMCHEYLSSPVWTWTSDLNITYKVLFLLPLPMFACSGLHGILQECPQKTNLVCIQNIIYYIYFFELFIFFSPMDVDLVHVHSKIMDWVLKQRLYFMWVLTTLASAQQLLSLKSLENFQNISVFGYLKN